MGALRLTTIGRRSGRERNVIIGDIEEGPDLVTLAMNGWDEGHPAWWLNLEAQPDAVARRAGSGTSPRARPPGHRRGDRLWKRGAEIDAGPDAYALRRCIETPLVVLEPRDERA